jgi:hypothetical protein
MRLLVGQVNHAKAAEKERRMAAWRVGEGRMSAVVGQELWESLCWQRGSFQHVYISSRFNKFALEQQTATDVARSTDAAAEAVAATTAPNEPPLPCGLLDRAITNLHQMLRSQGPISGDLDDTSGQCPLRSIFSVGQHPHCCGAV